MFPVTITLNNAEQLNAVLAAMNLGTNAIVGQVAEKTVEKTTAKKTPPVQNTSAATETANTQATAATTAAQEKKEEVSAPAKALLTADELTSSVKNAIAKVGRDPVVALLKEFGAAKASEVVADRRPEFDGKLLALAA